MVNIVNMRMVMDDELANIERRLKSLELLTGDHQREIEALQETVFTRSADPIESEGMPEPVDTDDDNWIKAGALARYASASVDFDGCEDWEIGHILRDNFLPVLLQCGLATEPEPVVTDAMVEAALSAFTLNGGYLYGDNQSSMRAAINAAMNVLAAGKETQDE